MYSLDCDYFNEEFKSIDDLLDHIFQTGMDLTKEINILNNIIMKISEDLYYSEQFSKEDIIGFLQKVVELEVDNVLDGIED
jgi:hypothetical protein